MNSNTPANIRTERLAAQRLGHQLVPKAEPDQWFLHNMEITDITNEITNPVFIVIEKISNRCFSLVNSAL